MKYPSSLSTQPQKNKRATTPKQTHTSQRGPYTRVDFDIASHTPAPQHPLRAPAPCPNPLSFPAISTPASCALFANTLLGRAAVFGFFLAGDDASALSVRYASFFSLLREDCVGSDNLRLPALPRTPTQSSEQTRNTREKRWPSNKPEKSEKHHKNKRKRRSSRVFNNIQKNNKQRNLSYNQKQEEEEYFTHSTLTPFGRLRVTTHNTHPPFPSLHRQPTPTDPCATRNPFHSLVFLILVCSDTKTTSTTPTPPSLPPSFTHIASPCSS